MTRPLISQGIVFTRTNDLERKSRFLRDVMVLDFVVDQGSIGYDRPIFEADQNRIGSRVISRCSMSPLHGLASQTASSSSTPRPGSLDGMT